VFEWNGRVARGFADGELNASRADARRGPAFICIVRHDGDAKGVMRTTGADLTGVTASHSLVLDPKPDRDVCWSSPVRFTGRIRASSPNCKRRLTHWRPRNGSSRPSLPHPRYTIPRGNVLYDYLIVGGGLAGATLAERLASQLNARILLIDRRDHIGGNCYDPINADGIRYHRYGPHIFHTNSRNVVAYLSRFTAWRRYEHRVLSRVNGQLLPLPITRTTINRLYGLELDDAGLETFLRARAIPSRHIDSSEKLMLSRVGRELYDLFFRGYTRKQWGLDPAQLDPTVCGRIPARSNDDDRYFSDAFQAMPADGFGAMVARMTADPRIEIVTGHDYRTIADRVAFNHVVFTGPIDEYFEHRYGRLPYRSLEFEFQTIDREWVQAAGCINEPSESVPYTRTTEYKHLTGQTHPKTVVSREFPRADGDPYYPIPRADNRALYERYRKLAARETHVTFVGRLAEYRYYNMDQVIASALNKFEALAAVAQIAS
jgi:UDP-galactopyranose mutase